MKTEITKDEALELALDELDFELSCTGIEEIDTILGWDNQVCIFQLSDGRTETAIYSDYELKGLGTENVILNLMPPDTNNGLRILFHFNVDELVSEYFELARKQ